MENLPSFEKYLETHRKQLENDLEKIFSNLFYTWYPPGYKLIDEIDGHNWRKTAPPSANIQRYLENRHIVEQDRDIKTVNRTINALDSYLKEKNWFDLQDNLTFLKKNPILFLSAEYGFVDWLQIYSGGLGVLAADFIKESSDLGIPLVGVGIFYHQGYFHQDIDFKGVQVEEYIPQNPAASFLRLIKDPSGNTIEVEIKIFGHTVYVRAWKLNVGRNYVILLDTNYEKNERWEDKMITAHLYGGNKDTRIRQEIVLGIGGLRFAKKMEINPSILHLNEGHASFAIIEKMSEFIDAYGDLDALLQKAKKNVLFTNHTLNSAGNDKFEKNLLAVHLNPYLSELEIAFDDFFNLGKDPEYSPNEFSMTIFGMKGAKKTNAVSKLHSVAAKKTWPDEDIVSITNGIHTPTWVCKPICELYSEYVHPRWFDPSNDVNWEKIYDIPDTELWKVHQNLKKFAIDNINSTLGTRLDPDKLTVVWTRRFASYKRPDIFLNDLIRLSKLTYHPKHHIQFLIGGKAHPQDREGKEILANVVRVTKSNTFKNKVVYLTGYNWNLAKFLVGGADLWLNNPLRFEEASGTSGMKSGSNGVLQFTTLDGWTDEVDWKDKGWVLPQERINQEIYEILENQISPEFHETNLPINWIKKMKNTMIMVMSYFNTTRMLKQYIEIYQELTSK